MKDWYCKPNSFEEAVEIVERAGWDGEGLPPVGIDVEVFHEGRWVAAATVGEFGHHEPCMVCAPNGGGFYGSTFTGDDNDTFSATEYLTIQQVRERFPLPSDKKEWNGEGLPPIGTVCVVVKQYSPYFKHHVGKEVRIIAHATDTIAVYEIDDGDCGLEFHGLVASCFAPIKSKRDEWIEKAAEAFFNQGGEINDNAFGAVYDGIVSGDLPIPEAE